MYKIKNEDVIFQVDKIRIFVKCFLYNLYILYKKKDYVKKIDNSYMCVYVCVWNKFIKYPPFANNVIF